MTQSVRGRDDAHCRLRQLSIRRPRPASGPSTPPCAREGVRGGLRAQLALQSIVTGQLVVSSSSCRAPRCHGGPRARGAGDSDRAHPSRQFVDRFEKSERRSEPAVGPALHTGLETSRCADLPGRRGRRTLRAADAALETSQDGAHARARDRPAARLAEGHVGLSRGVVKDVGQGLQQCCRTRGRSCPRSRRRQERARKRGGRRPGHPKDARKTSARLSPARGVRPWAARTRSRIRRRCSDASPTLDPDWGLGYQLSPGRSESRRRRRVSFRAPHQLSRHSIARRLVRPGTAGDEDAFTLLGIAALLVSGSLLATTGASGAARRRASTSWRRSRAGRDGADSRGVTIGVGPVRLAGLYDRAPLVTRGAPRRSTSPTSTAGSSRSPMALREPSPTPRRPDAGRSHRALPLAGSRPSSTRS